MIIVRPSFFKALFTLKQNSSGLLSVLELHYSDGQITCSVDGRPNRRNEAVFSNNSSGFSAPAKDALVP